MESIDEYFQSSRKCRSSDTSSTLSSHEGSFSLILTSATDHQCISPEKYRIGRVIALLPMLGRFHQFIFSRNKFISPKIHSPCWAVVTEGQQQQWIRPIQKLVQSVLLPYIVKWEETACLLHPNGILT
jgi:hypothetical protein